MNVFILCTGRCGSKTFIAACQHITNFSSAHESLIAEVGAGRLTYPENHIEADNRLCWFLGRLDKTYGDEAFYVHLYRDHEATAKSYAKRIHTGIARAYRKDILMGSSPLVKPTNVCRDYCDTVRSNIQFFLNDKTRVMEFSMENATDNFRTFWKQIQAEGDLDAALAEWDRTYNATDLEKREEVFQRKQGSLGLRIRKKAIRIIWKFPKFIRNA